MNKKHSVKYLKNVFFQGVYIGLTFSKERFLQECKYLKIDMDDPNPNERDARLWIFKKGGNLLLIILINTECFPKRITENEEKALLVHEVIHVWDEICSHIGEYKPTDELAAYHIQHLFLGISNLYDKRKKKEN